MRKIIPAFLITLFICVLSGHASDFRCTTNNGRITITGYIGAGGDIVIPDTINELPVTRIADRAFERNTLLTGVTLANSITNIGNYAFLSCNQLAFAVLPADLVSIGTSAFNSCSLSEISLPEGLVSIGQQAFFSCPMSGVHIPASVTNIVRGAFASRTNLTEITVDPLNRFYSAQDGVLFNAEGSVLVYYPAGKSGSIYSIPEGVSSVGGQAFWGAPLTDIIIPPSVTNLEVYAFYGAAQLAAVMIPDTVTSIGNWAFYSCRSLTEITVDENNPSYSSLDGVLFNKDQTVLIQCPQAKSGTFIIPDTVTAVGNYAFYSCPGLTGIVIPDGLISLGSYAFYSCNGLTEMFIPASVKLVETRAFSSCSSLTAISADENNASYSSLDGVLFNKDQTLLIQYPQAKSGSYAIPDGVERIGTYAFQSIPDLPDITFPDSLTRIDNDGFYGCGGLQRVEIPAGITNIGTRAFSNCPRLTEIAVDVGNPIYSSADGVLFNKSGTTLIQYPAGRKGSYAVPSGITVIGTNAFYNCDDLTSLRIPASTVTLQSQAFADCNQLTDLYFEGNYPSAVSSPLFTVFDFCKVHYLQIGTGWGASFMGRPSAEGPSRYLLTVEGGSGGGFYTNQQAVAVAADRAPDWKIFDRWIGDTQQLTEVAVSPSGFRMEARDSAIASTYQNANGLAVVAPRGAAEPPAGQLFYPVGHTLTCFVPETVIEQGILWRCTGWTGTGSVPASGTANTTGEIALTDLESSIQWHWETSFSINNITVQYHTGTKLAEITYDLISDLTNGVPVSLVVEKNGKPLPVYSLSGDAGCHVLPGTSLRMVWDIGRDWDENQGELSFTVRAGGLPHGMVLIPAGTNSGTDPDGSYSLTVTNSFAMDQFEVTKAQWDAVYAWAVLNGYAFDRSGSGKAGNHPVHTVDWYDSVKWLNARSEMEHLTPCYSVSNEVYRSGSFGADGSGNVLCNFEADGYRLPTLVEWRYAARGGLKELRFPWGDTITHEDANYRSTTNYSYDVSPTPDYHPDTSLPTPRSLPAGSFVSNGYGLYDIVGNTLEWCWTPSGESRYLLGGGWSSESFILRCRQGLTTSPSVASIGFGLRSVRTWNDTGKSKIISEPMFVEADSLTYYAVTVSSDRGQTDPETGSRSYLPESTVTLSAPETVIDQGLLWRCTGWTGTGSVPASGETNTTGEFVLTNLESSITWSWKTDFSITNLVAQQRSGTKLMEITYDIVSDVTNGVPVALSLRNGGVPVDANSLTGDIGSDVQPGTARQIVWDAAADWNLDRADLTFELNHAVYTQLGASGHFITDTLDYNLNVRSGPDSGLSVMGSHAGTAPYSHALPLATDVELIVPLSYMRGADRMRFAGWSGSITGRALIVNFSMTQAREVTAHYGLERAIQVTAPQNGRVEPAGTVAAAQGYPQTFTAAPDHGYRLKHWLVDGSITGEGQSSLTVDVTGNGTVAAVFEPVWLVLEGRSQRQRLHETGGKRGEPAVLKETMNTLLIVNRDRFGETNAVLVSWGNSGVPSAIPVTVSLEDSYLVSAKNDKAGLRVAERNLWSLCIRGDAERSVLIGTFDGTYRYDKSGILSRVQQRASLNGAGLSPEDPSFSAGLLRLNQAVGDALLKADGDFAAMAAALRTQIKKLPAGVTAETLGELLQNANGE